MKSSGVVMRLVGELKSRLALRAVRSLGKSDRFREVYTDRLEPPGRGRALRGWGWAASRYLAFSVGEHDEYGQLGCALNPVRGQSADWVRSQGAKWPSRALQSLEKRASEAITWLADLSTAGISAIPGVQH